MHPEEWEYADCKLEDFDGFCGELRDRELIDKIYRERTDPEDEDDESQEK